MTRASIRQEVIGTIKSKAVTTPIGEVTIWADNQYLRGLYFTDCLEKPPEMGDASSSQPILNAAESWLHDYFQGNVKPFSYQLIPAETEFQRNIRHQLLALPVGECISYSDLAARIGNENAVRAVGMANSRNPFLLMVPCHRVIAKNGAAHGYAGGVARKQWLIDFESKLKA